MNENLGRVTSLFSSTTGDGGIGKRASTYIESLTKTDGALKVAQDGITKTLKDLEDDYDRVQDRVTATVARYKAQFTQLDLVVAQMNRTSSYLTQQFNALNNSTKK
jgi:flagellar hook-associated protein 2